MKSRPASYRKSIFAEPLLARKLGVPQNRISQILAGNRPMTADTALRLGRYFGTTPEFWMNLQRSYDLDVAAQRMGNALSRIPQRPVTSIARHRGRQSAWVFSI